MAKLKSRRRKIGEICTRRDAIRNHCMECMGYMMAEIHRCDSFDCWLYPWRMGELDEEMVQREGIKPKVRKIQVNSPTKDVEHENDEE